MNRLKVIFLPEPHLFEPDGREVVERVGIRHDISVFEEAESLIPQFAGVEAVIDFGGSIGTREMMDAATDARLWQILGTGFDHFDLDYIRSKGIPVSNCPGQFSAVALAETALMFMLMLCHEYRQAAANFEAGTMYQPTVRELRGKTLGILGFGASGQQLARRSKPFGMRIMAVDVRTIEPEIIEDIRPDFIGNAEDIDKVVAESDIVSMHMPLNEETRHVIDYRRLSMMKPSAYLVNVARGALVDEEALNEVLMSGKIGGAGIDVFSQEPPDVNLPAYKLPNVVATPHIAGQTHETMRDRAACAADNVDRVACGEEPLYRIDQ